MQISPIDSFRRWAFRYSPVTGIDADGLGIWIEATGTSHLFAHATDFRDTDADDTDSGLRAMCADLYRQVSQTGLHASIASASTFGAAFALAHCHRDVSAQPVHALPAVPGCGRLLLTYRWQPCACH